MKLTEASVKKLVVPSDKDQWFADDDLDGFGIRFRRGVGVYGIRFYAHGRDRRMAFERIGKVTLADARTWARQQFGSLAHGIDPAVERAKAKVSAGNILADKIEPFLEYLQRNGRDADHIKDTKRSLEVHFKDLHKIPLADIDPDMIGNILDKISRSGRLHTANRAQSHLSMLFKWSKSRTNPAANILRNKEAPRERPLKDHELVAVWNALGTDAFSDILRLLILTGQRVSEIAGLMHSEIDVEKRLIVFDKNRIKNRQPHKLPLPDMAWNILEKRERKPGKDYVFGRCNSPFSGWAKEKAKLDGKLELPKWRIHDIRHSWSTNANDHELCAPWIVESVLNHAKAGVAGIYNNAEYMRQKLAALEAYSDWFSKLLGEGQMVA
jgi:integrase